MKLYNYCINYTLYTFVQWPLVLFRIAGSPGGKLHCKAFSLTPQAAVRTKPNSYFKISPMEEMRWGTGVMQHHIPNNPLILLCSWKTLSHSGSSPWDALETPLVFVQQLKSSTQGCPNSPTALVLLTALSHPQQLPCSGKWEAPFWWLPSLGSSLEHPPAGSCSLPAMQVREQQIPKYRTQSERL